MGNEPQDLHLIQANDKRFLRSELRTSLNGRPRNLQYELQGWTCHEQRKHQNKVRKQLMFSPPEETTTSEDIVNNGQINVCERAVISEA